MTRRYHVPPTKQNLSLLKFQNSNIIMIFQMHIQLLLKSIQTMLKFENPLRNIRWLWNQRPLLIGTSPSNWEKPLHLEMTLATSLPISIFVSLPTLLVSSRFSKEIEQKLERSLTFYVGGLSFNSIKQLTRKVLYKLCHSGLSFRTCLH